MNVPKYYGQSRLTGALLVHKQNIIDPGLPLSDVSVQLDEDYIEIGGGV